MKTCIDCGHCDFKSLDGVGGTSCSVYHKPINGYDGVSKCPYAIPRGLQDKVIEDSIKGALEKEGQIDGQKS